MALAGALVQASPARAADACPNAAIRAQQGVERLPECRAYEQVSPVEKGGNDVVAGVGPISPRMQVAADGRSLAFASMGGFAGTPGAPQVTYYRAVREAGPTGWATSSMTPPMAPVPDAFQANNSVLGISEDGTRAVVGTHAALTPDAVEGNGNLYLRDNRTGTYELMAGSSDPRFRSGVVGLGAVWVGGNSDYSHVVFTVTAALTPGAYDGGGAGGQGWNVYEWADHRLRLVDVPPDGVPQFRQAFAGNGMSNPFEPRYVSEDGARVFFIGSTSADIGAATLLYVREAGTVSRPLAIAAHPALPPGPAPSMFEAASRDGSKVLLTTWGLLEAEPGVDPNSKGLYLYDLSRDTLTNLAAPADPETTPNAVSSTVLGTTDDFSTIYFSSTSALQPGAVPDAPNLYVAHAGEVKTVAVLSSDIATRSVMSSYVGDRGELAFAARTPLTGYDNTNPDCTAGRCRQVFVYDPARDTLTCASCPGDGVRPVGDATVGGQNDATSAIDHFGRAVLDDGRVFFDTAQSLVDHDTNGRIDVYQFRDGRRELISGGRDDADSYFGDATADGRDVFFTTSQRLVAQDRDGLFDVYDAKLDGGLASQMAGPAGASCTDDDCQGPATTRPTELAVASGTGDGVGDAAPRTAGRPTVRLSAVRTVRGTTARLRVTVSGAGTIAVRGARVRAAARRVSRRGAYVMSAALTPGARRSLSRRATLRVSVRVTFRPHAGRTVSTRMTVTFKRATRLGHGARAHRTAVEGGRS